MVIFAKLGTEIVMEYDLTTMERDIPTTLVVVGQMDGGQLAP